MGLGGGFLLTIYTKKSGIVETLNARETAPGAAHKDMYENNTSQAKTGMLIIIYIIYNWLYSYFSLVYHLL